jgi:hypothetical protein
MRLHHGGYLAATRHPWPCLLFLLPLLCAYEIGVVRLGGAHPEQLRNGADTWLRWGLESFGLTQFYFAPALITGVFLLCSWLRFFDRPDGILIVWFGMALESTALALGLWSLSQELVPFLERFGVTMSWSLRAPEATRIVMYVGAGIYEEVLFRLLLFTGLAYLLRLWGSGPLWCTLVATVGSALVFSAAHHVGAYGEPFDRYVFFFRTLAGVYFALIYRFRGFAIAVGTHAGYDLLVGVLMA